MKYNLNFQSDKNGKQIMEMAMISQVAHMYYDLNMQQPEIAEKLFFSRSKVSRMLKRGRELGIVDIKVRRILDRSPSIEKELKYRFGIREAIVISNYEGDTEDMLDAVTNFAALFVSNLMKGNRVVGVSQGRTITEVTHKLTKNHECNLEIVQLMGGNIRTDSSMESRELVDCIASIYGGNCYYLNTPLYVNDLYAKEVLMQDPSVQSAMNMMKKCDYILTGLGSCETKDSNPNWFGYLNKRHLDELRKKVAVGSICGRFFDIQGRPIPCEWNKKCISIPFEDINSNNITIGVAAGDHKVLPILGALQGHLIDIVITDSQTAMNVLQRQNMM